MNTQQQAKAEAHKVIASGNIGMRCLITKSSYGSFGFRFDPSNKYAAGDIIRDCENVVAEVLDVIRERE